MFIYSTILSFFDERFVCRCAFFDFSAVFRHISLKIFGSFFHIYCLILGTQGKTGMINLSSWRNDFESGHKDKYVVQAMDVGEVVIISLHIDECFGISNPGWFVDKILVTSSTQEKAFLFPCYRWIQSDMVVCQGKGTLAYQLNKIIQFIN